MTPTIENPLSQSSENPLSKHWFYPVGFKLGGKYLGSGTQLQLL